MDPVAAVVALVVGVIAVSAVARFLRFPAPILLVAVGVVVSFLPRVPKVELDPDLVLFVLLPPLLYAAAIRSSLLDIRRLVRPIVALAVGLVLVTVVAVGFGLHAVVPASPWRRRWPSVPSWRRPTPSPPRPWPAGPASAGACSPCWRARASSTTPPPWWR